MVRRRTAARKKRAAYAKLDTSAVTPARRGGFLVLLVLGALVVVNLYVFVWDKKTSVGAIKEKALAQPGPGGGPSMSVPSQPLIAGSATTGSAAAGASGSGAPGVPSHIAAPAVASVIDGKVGKSDTLGRLLKHNGLSASETDEVIHALSGVLDFRALKTGQAFRIERGVNGRVARFDLEVSKNHHVRATRGAAGSLVGEADK